MPIEQRRYPRIPLAFNAQYRLYGQLGQAWHTVRVVDVSAVGIRFESQDVLEVMEAVELELFLPGLRQPLIVRGAVIWTHVTPSGTTESGVEFQHVESTQQAQLDELVQFVMKRPQRPNAAP